MVTIKMLKKKFPIGDFWLKVKAVKFCKVKGRVCSLKDIRQKNRKKLKFSYRKKRMIKRAFLSGEIAHQIIKSLSAYFQNK
jgi:hypothetical protein